MSGILVAEDDLGVRELIRARLSIAGHNVHIAKTGADALARTLELRPDAVVLDINMPDLDGFGYLTALKTHMAVARPPVLVLTARHSADDVRRALELGAKDYLTKPFNDQQLLARVARLLRRSSMGPAAPTAPHAQPAPVAAKSASAPAY
jgi:DNA-binding response OmpR family regulator